MNTSTQSGTASTNAHKSNKRSRRPSRKSHTKVAAPSISITANTVITCAVAATKHPDSGVIVTITGNPNGYIPNRLLAGKNEAAKSERRAFLLANPGTILDAFVETAVMAAPKVKKADHNNSGTNNGTSGDDNGSTAKKSDAPTPANLRPRIILNEDKVVLGNIIRARKEAEANLRAEVERHTIGWTMTAMVKCFATKKNDNNDGRHVIGVFVELASGLPALLHKSQMFDIREVKEGDVICVAIRTAEMDGKRAKVSVTQVRELTTEASAPAPAAPRSASQTMWDNVAAALNEDGSGPLIVIDPSV